MSMVKLKRQQDPSGLQHQRKNCAIFDHQEEVLAEGGGWRGWPARDRSRWPGHLGRLQSAYRTWYTGAGEPSRSAVGRTVRTGTGEADCEHMHERADVGTGAHTASRTGPVLGSLHCQAVGQHPRQQGAGPGGAALHTGGPNDQGQSQHLAGCMFVGCMLQGQRQTRRLSSGAGGQARVWQDEPSCCPRCRRSSPERTGSPRCKRITAHFVTQSDPGLLVATKVCAGLCSDDFPLAALPSPPMLCAFQTAQCRADLECASRACQHLR